MYAFGLFAIGIVLGLGVGVALTIAWAASEGCPEAKELLFGKKR